MEPTFNYPTGPEDVWVKCEKNDFEADSYWCPEFALWSANRDADWKSCPSGKCGQIWRKRVKVPENWVVVPEDETETADMRFLQFDRWFPNLISGPYHKVSYYTRAIGGTVRAFIRPIAKASEITAEEVTDAGVTKVTINPYAVTLKGVTFDYYDFCRANGMTDQPIAHAFKKLWRHGKGHKTAQQDVQEAIDSLKRWQEIEGVK